MTERLVLDLVDKELVTDQLVLTIGYDRENLDQPQAAKSYRGEVTTDRYGRKIPKSAHGTANLERPMSSSQKITTVVMTLCDQILDPALSVRRINVTANHVQPESAVNRAPICNQLDLNPYELISGGCLLIAADNGTDLIRNLEKENIPAAIVGKATGGNDRVIRNGEEKRFLEPPKTDELYKISFGEAES